MEADPNDGIPKIPKTSSSLASDMVASGSGLVPAAPLASAQALAPSASSIPQAVVPAHNNELPDALAIQEIIIPIENAVPQLPIELINDNQLVIPEEPIEVVPIDNQDLILRIFNFHTEIDKDIPFDHVRNVEFLNQLIQQCIGTTNQPAALNHLPISPYTPIKPSEYNIKDLPEYCILALMEQFTTLQELVEKALVCTAWIPPVEKIIKHRVQSNCLKVFDDNINVALYKETALTQYNLARLDPAAGVQQTGNRKEDHILVQLMLNDDNILQVKSVIEKLFEGVTYLVLHSTNINHAELIRSMVNLTSITLFDPPNSKGHLNDIWEALNATPELRHVHIFDSNGDLTFEADKMDFLTRIESFTLDNYKSDNLIRILKRLGPHLRCLQIGSFECETELLEQLIAQNREMVANLTQLSVRLDEMRMVKAPLNEPYHQSYLVHKRILDLIVENFTELTYLDAEFASLMFYTEVIDNLRKLPKLTELRFATRPNDVSTFLEFPNELHRFPVPDLGAQPLPNIRKMYLTKNNLNDNDYQFLCRIFGNNGVTRAIFPGVEQAIFVLNEATVTRNRMDYLNTFRGMVRGNISSRYWHRLQLYNVTLGTLKEHFFATEQELAEEQEWNAPIMLDIGDNVPPLPVHNNELRPLIPPHEEEELEELEEEQNYDALIWYRIHAMPGFELQVLDEMDIEFDEWNGGAIQPEQRDDLMQPILPQQDPRPENEQEANPLPENGPGPIPRQANRRRPVRQRPQNRREPVQRQPARREPVQRQPARREPVQRQPARREPVQRPANRRQPNNPGNQYRRVNGRIERATD